MSQHHAADYRRRADDLRRLATRIETTPAMSLDRHAGVDTWRGPRPHLCETELEAMQRSVHEAADDLRWTALDFERRAAELDASAIRLGMDNTSGAAAP